ncbi:F-box C protein [Caenorhabditis elegans]|nr:F-box C protein [Caenorhabditis elegans]CAI9665330.1 F-box C protein [Caenorhabditis elegans]
MERNVPYRLKSVQITDDQVSQCCRVWIDGMIIRFDYTRRRKDFCRVVTSRMSTLDLPDKVISRCILFYLNRKDIHIKQLTINKMKWPVQRFFPKNVVSLKIITARGMENSLRLLKNVHFKRVIVDNQCDTSTIFEIPMIYEAKYLMIDTVDMINEALLDMPLVSAAKINQKMNANSTFIDFVQKLIDSENLCIGLKYTATSHDHNFVLRNLKSELRVRINVRKTNWKGRNCLTIDMEGEKELVISWYKTGTVFFPKHHVTAQVLNKGSSKNRASGVIEHFVNVYTSLRNN